MGKVVLLVVLLFGVSCAASRDASCHIPVQLPPWQELVMRLWASDRISDKTFLKNFSISGEQGDKLLRAQDYDPADLETLGRCLVWHFKL